MAERTNIAWTDHTFNPWRGCQKVSPGCAHCYAEALSARNPAVLGEWGPGGERVIASEAYWRQPLRWDRMAQAAGVRRRVFCASLADVFEDRPELESPRLRLVSLIHQTPGLDWLLLTKRPAFMRQWIEHHHHSWTPDMKGPPLNVWLGVSVEDRQRAGERIPHLLQVPAAVRFLSCEPLLGDLGRLDLAGIHWVIVGGESGPHARPMNPAWLASIARQCQAAGVALFVKQGSGLRPGLQGNIPDHLWSLKEFPHVR